MQKGAEFFLWAMRLVFRAFQYSSAFATIACYWCALRGTDERARYLIQKKDYALQFVDNLLWQPLFFLFTLKSWNLIRYDIMYILLLNKTSDVLVSKPYVIWYCEYDIRLWIVLYYSFVYISVYLDFIFKT